MIKTEISRRKLILDKKNKSHTDDVENIKE